jgi:hypothetical protein
MQAFDLISVVEKDISKEQKAFVYTGRTHYGALLVKWFGVKRVLFVGWDTQNPIGRKKLLEAVQRYRSFKGHKVDNWIFVASRFRQNTYRLIDEYPVSIIEIDGPGEATTILGNGNMPEGMFSTILSMFSRNNIRTTYEFDGLVEQAKSDENNSKVTPVAQRAKKVTAFISYSWDSEQHRGWVLKLAANLIRNGVNVLIDEWDLEDYGNDLNLFMESAVRDSDFVLMICTSSYARRANSRTGGVGVESTIITGELYGSDNSNKFIPIAIGAKSNLEDCLPTFLRGKLAVLFSETRSYESSFEELLRRIAGKPRFRKPELGTFPELPEKEI